jgi:DnaK suppressor protein
MNTLSSQHIFNATLREKLWLQRTELLQRMAYERGGVVGRAEVAADQYDNTASDNAQLRSEREAGFAMSEHETAELADIDRAIQQMDAGHYGICIDCSAEIPKPRLVATPTAVRCIPCQSKVEFKLAHP